jgi:hypothetical protein
MLDLISVPPLPMFFPKDIDNRDDHRRGRDRAFPDGDLSNTNHKLNA